MNKQMGSELPERWNITHSFVINTEDEQDLYGRRLGFISGQFMVSWNRDENVLEEEVCKSISHAWLLCFEGPCYDDLNKLRTVVMLLLYDLMFSIFPSQIFFFFLRKYKCNLQDKRAHAAVPLWCYVDASLQLLTSQITIALFTFVLWDLPFTLIVVSVGYTLNKGDCRSRPV